MKIPDKILGVDIETSEAAQDDKISPITVASTVTSDGEKRAWFSHPTDKSVVGMAQNGDNNDWSNFSKDGQLSPLMSKETALALLKYMEEKQRQGYALCAWNGAGFDLKMIGALAENMELAGRMALNLIDPMYQILTMKGYPVGLGAVQKGLGVDQSKSMSGADAPEAWSKGEFARVIGYVIGDSEITVKIIQAIGKAGGVKWTTKTGKPASLLFNKLKTVSECLLEPEPNNSWMDTPIDRHKIISWIPESAKTELSVENSSHTMSDPGKINKPVLIVLSGPSGVGKSEICNNLTKCMPSIKRIVKFTTRQPRENEVDGVDYHFVKREQFDKLVMSGEFLEHSTVNDNFYGTLKIDVSKTLATGTDAIVIVDVNGAKMISAFYAGLPDKTRARFGLAKVFINPPSIFKTESSEYYKYHVVNKNNDRTVDLVRSIVIAERCSMTI